MEITLLGTGTSQGVPMIACSCAVCRSADPRNRRTRTSVHVVLDGRHIQVDAAQEFRLQCLAGGVEAVDLFILTHGHADHVSGMDDLRRFCDLRDGEALPVYSTPEGLDRVRAMYPYAIHPRPVARGYPAFELRQMPERLDLPEGAVLSTILPHGPMRVLGLIFLEASTGRKFVYYTDCKQVDALQRKLAAGADLLVLDGLRPEPHPTHLSIPEAVEVAREIGARRTLLTHLTHAVDHAEWDGRLPEGIRLGHDGLKIVL